MDDREYVHLEVELITKATGKAFLLVLEDGEQVWMPFSQIADVDDYAEGDEDVTISVTEWIAEQKGLA